MKNPKNALRKKAKKPEQQSAHVDECEGCPVLDHTDDCGA